MMVKITLYDPNCICNPLLLAYPGFPLVSLFISALQFSFFFLFRVTFQLSVELFQNTAEYFRKKRKKIIECVPRILIKIKAGTVNLRFN